MQTIAGILLNLIRSGDMVALHGPRSFAILAPDARQAGALRLAERIKEALPERLEANERVVVLKPAIGIAILPEAGSSFHELLRHAQEALSAAMAGAESGVMISGQAGAEPAPAPVPVYVPVETEPETPLQRQRRAAMALLSAAFAHHVIDGVALQTQPGSCPVCLDTARDLYRPSWLPPLPVAGCMNPAGCRCFFTSPALQSTWSPAPVPVSHMGDLDIPRKYRDAALFGSDPRRDCKPVDLAEYLEQFPPLALDAELTLQPLEVVFLSRPARLAWEQETPASVAIRGPEFPLSVPLLPWVRDAARPPALPNQALPSPQEGTLFITNQRLLFASAAGLDGVPLLDITAIEHLRDGIACRVGEWTNRLVLLVRSPLPAGIILAWATRRAILGR